MDNTASFKIGNNPDIEPFRIGPFYTGKENAEILNKSFNKYIECGKRNSPECTPFNESFSFEPPSEFLMNKIIQQVEYLFSDANLLKDKFLLKHIKRNKEGYVSLKLISSLRKVKALTRDWRVVAFSLQRSQKLHLNDEMTKIRRTDPVKDLKVLDTSRTVLVFHYLPNCWSLDSLKKQLKMMGTVVLLELVSTKEDVWYVRVQKTLSFYGKIATLPFAIAMFETPDEAANAVLQTSHPSSIILKMVPLLEEGEKTFSKNNSEYPVKNPHCPAENMSVGEIARFGKKTGPGDEFYSVLPNFCLSVTNGGCVYYYNGKNSGNPQADMQSQILLKDKKPFISSYKLDEPAHSTGCQRKSCFRNHREARVIILRQPRGPDGTKGFRNAEDIQIVSGYNMCLIY